MFTLNIFTYLLIVLVVTKVTADYPCSIHLSVNIDDAESHHEGGLIHNDVVYPKHLHFEYDPQDGHQGIFHQDDFHRKHRRGCLCELRTCFRKCCPENKSFGAGRKCVDSDLQLNETVYNFEGLPVEDGFDNFHAVFDVPCVNASGTIINKGAAGYHMYKDGSLYFNETKYKASEYCIENFVASEDVLVILKCPVKEPHMLDSIQHTIHSIGMILSLPFLIATLVVYIILPELRTLHGKFLMCYVSSLTVSYISLVIAKLGNIRNASCVAIGYIIYYSIMLSFFWLNLISYDIWWTFSGFRGYKGRKLTPEWKKFIYFCIYTFGCTSIATITMAILQEHSDKPAHYNANIGFEDTCWIQKDALMTYFYGPLIVLSLINIVFFASTAFKIYGSTRRSTGVLKREGSTKHCPAESDRQRFWLYMKLFLIMGVSWSIEIFNYWIEGPNWIWVFVDSINVLQGVLIFVLFVWKPKIRKMLKNKIQGLKETSTGTSVASVSSNRNSSRISMDNLKLTDDPNPNPE